MHLSKILADCEWMDDWGAREPGGRKRVKKAVQEYAQPRGLRSKLLFPSTHGPKHITYATDHCRKLYFFFFLNFGFIYLFIFGCVGSSFLCEGFL